MPPKVTKLQYLFDSLNKFVTDNYNVDIRSKSRKREIVQLRCAVSMLILNNTSCTLFKIGQLIGKHHSTLVHYRSMIDVYDRFDLTFRKQHQDLKTYADSILEVDCDDLVRSANMVINYMQRRIDSLNKTVSKIQLDRDERRDKEYSEQEALQQA